MRKNSTNYNSSDLQGQIRRSEMSIKSKHYFQSSFLIVYYFAYFPLYSCHNIWTGQPYHTYLLFT